MKNSIFKMRSLLNFLFDLLISTQDFLYARKLIASTDFYEAFEQRVIEKIHLQKNYPTNGEAEDQGTPTINRRNFLRWNLHVSLRPLDEDRTASLS